MKGLLRKDFYLALKYCRMQLGVALVFPVLACLGEGSVFLLAYPFMLVAMIPVSLMANDEHDHWDSYCACLPCSRAQIVTAKYLVGAAAILLTWLLIGLVLTVSGAVRGDLDPEALAGTLALLFCAGSLPASFCQPFIFRLGSEKGRVAYIVTIGLFCALAAGMGAMDTPLTGEGAKPAILLPAAAASLVLYAASWALSVKLYEKRGT